jgi:hypothetical protein
MVLKLQNLKNLMLLIYLMKKILENILSRDIVENSGETPYCVQALKPML